MPDTQIARHPSRRVIFPGSRAVSPLHMLPYCQSLEFNHRSGWRPRTLSSTFNKATGMNLFVRYTWSQEVGTIVIRSSFHGMAQLGKNQWHSARFRIFFAMILQIMYTAFHVFDSHVTGESLRFSIFHNLLRFEIYLTLMSCESGTKLSKKGAPLGVLTIMEITLSYFIVKKIVLLSCS